jgi:hypothetical protein
MQSERSIKSAKISVKAVYVKVFWTTQAIRSDVINVHTGPKQILSDRKT